MDAQGACGHAPCRIFLVRNAGHFHRTLSIPVYNRSRMPGRSRPEVRPNERPVTAGRQIPVSWPGVILPAAAPPYCDPQTDRRYDPRRTRHSLPPIPRHPLERNPPELLARTLPALLSRQTSGVGWGSSPPYVHGRFVLRGDVSILVGRASARLQ